MNCYRRRIEIDIRAGTPVVQACAEACALALADDAIVYFRFNGVWLTAHAYSQAADLVCQYEERYDGADAVPQTAA